MHGTVIRSTGAAYTVRTDEGKLVECKVKGHFRLRGIRSTNPVAVGDGVTIARPDEPATAKKSKGKRKQKAATACNAQENAPASTNAEGNTEMAYITDIDERRNYIVRKASNLSKQSHILAANVDQALLIATVARPETSTTFIDRFLASAEAYRVPVIIAFNKTDDLSPEERDTMAYMAHIYEGIGYKVAPISALKDEGMATLRTLLQHKVTLLAGHSGVGKSTLLNLLVPGANARTAEISEAHGTGMHTTTFSELFDLPGGGALIDIPGVKGYGTYNMEPSEVAHYFRDIFAISAECRFGNCTHTHEPGCAVLRALDEHRLAPSRYASYLSMLDDKNESKYRAAY